MKETSDFSLLGHFKCIVHLDSQVSDRTFNLGVAEE